MTEEPIVNEEQMKPQVEAVFEEMIKLPEVQEALDLLDKLPENLKYHNKNHTFDVLRETILFSLADGASEQVIKEQCIAAAWHDVGYIKQFSANEPVAVELLKSSKTFSTLDKEDEAEIEANILDTQMIPVNGIPTQQKNRSHFAYILDGDVSNFGRSDYFQKSEEVAQELGIDFNNPEAKRKFYIFAFNLLKNHDWKTESARKLRQAQKEENMAKLEDEIQRLAA